MPTDEVGSTRGRSVVSASAIVLAGGRSSRFGSQKLASLRNGVPLLHLALGAVSPVCEEILVVGSPAGLPVAIPLDLLARVTEVLDEQAFEGPLVALVGAAAQAANERLLVVGGDMPELRPRVLQRLLSFPDERDGACLMREGVPHPLPVALRRRTVLDQGRDLVVAGQRSLRALLDGLDFELVPESEWSRLDPEARTLFDVDRPEDLDGRGDVGTGRVQSTQSDATRSGARDDR